MDNLRNERLNEETNTLLSQQPQAYIPTVQPTIPSDRVTYAQIIRPAGIQLSDTNEQFDFRMQTAQQNSNLTSSPVVISGRSSISEVSSGYIDLTQNLARPQVRKNARPTSPETSF